MSLQQAVDQLLKSGRKAALPESEPTGRALRELLGTPEMESGMRVRAPWQLEAAGAVDLEDRLDYSPSCGWSNLVGLAAGTGLINAEHDLFVRAAGFEELLAGRDDEALQHLLYNAFASNLVPPAAAAALYVTIDLHPIWGLHLARARGVTMASVGVADVDSLKCAAKFVFGTIAGFATALRQCDADMRYSTDSLADVLTSSASAARRMAGVDAVHRALPITTVGASERVAPLTSSLAVQDFFDLWLAPSGAARRDNTGWFSTTPSVLAGGMAGDLTVKEQTEWYAAALDIEQGAR